MFSRSIIQRSTLAAAGVALAVSVALTGCGADASAGSASGGSAAEEAAAAPGLNVPVTAGSFEFTALAAADAGPTVGTEPLTQTAQGSYFKLDLKVSNVGDDSQMFIVDYVKLEDAEGKTYDADASASLYAGGDAQTWISAINPGNAVEGPILFDVPAGVTPVTVLVSGDMFSDGTPITLG